MRHGNSPVIAGAGQRTSGTLRTAGARRIGFAIGNVPIAFGRNPPPEPIGPSASRCRQHTRLPPCGGASPAERSACLWPAARQSSTDRSARLAPQPARPQEHCKDAALHTARRRMRVNRTLARPVHLLTFPCPRALRLPAVRRPITAGGNAQSHRRSAREDRHRSNRTRRRNCWRWTHSSHTAGSG